MCHKIFARLAWLVLIAMERLGLTAFRLPTRLADLDESSSLFAAQHGRLEASQLLAWAQRSKQQPVTSLQWDVVLSTVKARSAGLWQHAGPHFVALLAWAAQTARQELQRSSKGNTVGTGGVVATDGDDPRRPLALRNSLKLGLFFLCTVARGEHGGLSAHAEFEAEPHAGKQRGKKGSSTVAAAVLCSARLRRDALLAVAAIDEALRSDGGLLPAVADKQAAARLVWAAALHCLARPLEGPVKDRAAKELVESFQKASTGGCWYFFFV